MLHDVSISSHLVPDVGVGARVVVCTTNGNGSRMSRHWDADEGMVYTHGRLENWANVLVRML